MPVTISNCTARRGARCARLAALALVSIACAQGAWAARAPAEGDVAPPLEARLFDGRTLDLAALRGQVVVLNLWASWCTPCRREMPVLEALGREYAARGVIVLGLSADDRRDRREAERIARRYGYALGLLAEAPRNGFGSLAALPLTYIIDAQGRIVKILRAADGTVERDLRAAIEAQLVPAAETMRGTQ